MLYTKSKYEKGEIVEINSWTKVVKNARILNMAEIYNQRSKEYEWGYKVDKTDTGHPYIYIPEGYLTSKKELRKKKYKRLNINEI